MSIPGKHGLIGFLNSVKLSFVNSSHQKTPTAAKSVPLPSQKPAPSFVPGPLTPHEIESLRQDSKASSLHSQEYFQQHAPHLAHKS